MRMMLFLNVDMNHCVDLLGPAQACCESTKMSNQSFAVPASSRPSKNFNIASSVSAKGLLHVWLTNQVAGPTFCAVALLAHSSSATLQRCRDVRGRKYIFSNCEVVMRPSDGPNSSCSNRKYSSEMP